MNLGLSLKLSKWKSVATHTHLSSFATGLFREAWLKWRVVSAIHIHGGWEGKPWAIVFLGPRRACLPWQESNFFVQSNPTDITGEIKAPFVFHLCLHCPAVSELLDHWRSKKCDGPWLVLFAQPLCPPSEAASVLDHWNKAEVFPCGQALWTQTTQGEKCLFYEKP